VWTARLGETKVFHGGKDDDDDNYDDNYGYVLLDCSAV
jgi:hypothetical protein